MLSSSTNGVGPLYDKLSEYRKEGVSSDYDKRTGSVSSDGHTDQLQSVTVDMYASDGRIDTVMAPNLGYNNGASAQDTTAKQMFSSTGKIQAAHSLSPPPHQSALSHQHLPSSLRSDQRLLCPPRLTSMTGSSPAVSFSQWLLA